MAIEKAATWLEINSKVGSTGTPDNQCPTKSAVEATNKATVSGSYTDNQLVTIAAISQSDHWIHSSMSCTMVDSRGMTGISAVIDGTSTVVPSRLDEFDEGTGRQYFSLDTSGLSSDTLLRVTFNFDIPDGYELGSFDGITQSGGYYLIVDRTVGYVVNPVKTFDSNGGVLGSWKWDFIIDLDLSVPLSFRITNPLATPLQGFTAFYTEESYNSFLTSASEDTIYNIAKSGGSFMDGEYRDGTIYWTLGSTVTPIYGIVINGTKTKDWSPYLDANPSSISDQTSFIYYTIIAIP